MKLKPLSLISSALLIAASTSWSSVLIHEPFTYPDGLLGSQGGWSIYIGTNSPVAVSNGAISLVSGAGNRQQIALPLGARLSSGKVFVSYDLKVSAYNAPYFYSQLSSADNQTFAKVFLIAPAAGGNYRLSIGNNNFSAPEDLATADLQFNTAYKVVVSYDYDTGLSELWVNPSSESSPKLSSIGDINPGRGVNQLIFAQGSSNAVQTLDNLIVATSFTEVLSAPGPLTPVQGPTVEAYAAIYSAEKAPTPDLLTQAIPVYDWANQLPEPSKLIPHGVVQKYPGLTLMHIGWPTTFSENDYVGFTVSTNAGEPLTVSSLEFTTANGGGITAYKWGYRTNQGSWVYGPTYTSATPGFDQGLKSWDFPDVTFEGQMELGLFATTADGSGFLLPFQTTATLRTPGLFPAPTLTQNTLGKYKKIVSHEITVSEASGLTYNWDRDTLFCIGDEGRELVEMTRAGKNLGTMPFQYNVSPRDRRALDDSEGLAYLGDDQILIADERRNLAVETTYVPGLLRVLADLQPTSYPFGMYDGNTGLEGIAYDPINHSIWGVKENAPFRLYEMTNFDQPSRVVSEPIALRYLSRFGVTQFSDVYALALSGAFTSESPRYANLLLLHRNRSQVYEINRAGEVVGLLDVSSFGRTSIEGITMDDKGNIYLCAEGGFGNPDLLYVISEEKNAVTGTGRGRAAMVGTTGDDEIYGNPAADTLTGGEGKNTFVFKSLRDGVDTITDFKPAVDTLDLSVLLASMSYPGLNPLVDGTLRILDNADGALVQVVSGSSYRTLIILQGLTASQANATNNFRF